MVLRGCVGCGLGWVGVSRMPGGQQQPCTQDSGHLPPACGRHVHALRLLLRLPLLRLRLRPCAALPAAGMSTWRR